MFSFLKKKDLQLYRLIKKEIKRQKETLNLIASENIAPPEILEVLGSPLVNKYSEGYPGKRYYPGNIYYDEIEKLTQRRALDAFHLSPEKWAVNVQPYSGSPANLEVYNALLKPGDKLMGMSLFSGGHLTHGHFANLSGKLYQVIQYSVNPRTEKLDYQEIEELARKFRPQIIVSGTTSYPRKINFSRFSKIAHQLNAYSLADISHIAGLVAAGLHPSPFLSCDIVTTTLHKTLRGPRAAVIFINKKSKIARQKNIDLESLINRSVFPQMQGGPHNNVTAAIALTFYLVRQKSFIRYQQQIIKNTSVLAQELKQSGFRLVSGGTDNHLLVLDLRNIGLSGKTAEKILEEAHILANRNVIPGDRKPFNPSGIRIGTPAVTSRGMKEKEMKKIAEFITRLLIDREKPKIIAGEVKKMLTHFPLPY